jgi:hypothetical protein
MGALDRGIYKLVNVLLEHGYGHIFYFSPIANKKGWCCQLYATPRWLVPPSRIIVNGLSPPHSVRQDVWHPYLPPPSLLQRESVLRHCWWRLMWEDEKWEKEKKEGGGGGVLNESLECSLAGWMLKERNNVIALLTTSYYILLSLSFSLSLCLSLSLSLSFYLFLSLSLSLSLFAAGRSDGRSFCTDWLSAVSWRGSFYWAS